jgi:hypothetical protein
MVGLCDAAVSSSTCRQLEVNQLHCLENAGSSDIFVNTVKMETKIIFKSVTKIKTKAKIIYETEQSLKSNF